MGNAKRVAPAGKIAVVSPITAVQTKLILILICVLCYGNTLFNKYSLDDDFAVYENPLVQKGIAGIPEILTSPYVVVKEKSADYRPIVGITYALENQIFGNNPHVSHFVNLLLYTILILIVYSVLLHAFQLNKIHPLLPLFITLVYAVHPSHTEVVASIKNRDEILSFIFSATALKFAGSFFTIEKDRLRNGGYVLLFMLLAYLSKVISIPLVGIIILMGIYYGFWKERKPFIIFCVSLTVITFAYFAAIILFLERPMYDLENPLVGNTNVSINAGTILETLLFYFKFLLVPFPSRFYYGFNVIPLIDFFTPVALLSLVLYGGILISGIILFKRKQILGFFLLAYVLNILFYCNIIRYPGIVSERILFIPSFWFSASLVLLLFKLGKMQGVKGAMQLAQKLVVVLIVVILTAYIALTIRRNFQWKDRLTLMQADMPHLENSALANYFYAEALSSAKKKSNSKLLRQVYTADAKKHYKQALKVAPAYPDPYYELGMIYEYNEGNRDSAFYYFSNGHRLNLADNPTKFQLSKQYYLRQDDVQAEKLLSQLYRDLPTDTFTLYFYARVLYNLNRQQEAFNINAALMKLNPNSPYAYVNYGLFYQNRGDAPTAAANYEKALILGFRDEEIFNSLLNYYLETNQSEKVAQLRRLQ